MSAFADVVRSIREVMLLQDKVERLEKSVAEVGGDLKGLVQVIGVLEQRLARLEGFIEGAAAASGARPQLPRE